MQDEAAAKAMAELEQKLHDSMIASSQALARVAELEEQLKTAAVSREQEAIPSLVPL